MKLSKLIEKLQKEFNENGEVDVVVNGHEFTTNAIHFDYTPYYYDGGVILKDPKFDGHYHCNKWLKSKKHPELGDRYLYITCDEPDLLDGNEYIEGKLIPEIPSSSQEDWDEFEKNYNKNKEIFRKA